MKETDDELTRLEIDPNKILWKRLITKQTVILGYRVLAGLIILLMARTMFPNV